jgi:RNA polymerase sigma-70 factor (ECF subfamily)
MNQPLLQAVRRARAGIEVEDSFRVIDAQLSPRLLNYFQAHRFSHADAEDLVQKTLAAVYKNISQLEDDEKFLAWLFTIARNIRYTAIKQRQHESNLMAGGIELAENLPDPRTASSSFDGLLDAEKLVQVREAIDSLPAQQRRCLSLRVQHEMSYEEIADALKLSVNTVRNHLAEAKKSLRRKFDPGLEEELNL